MLLLLFVFPVNHVSRGSLGLHCSQLNVLWDVLWKWKTLLLRTHKPRSNKSFKNKFHPNKDVDMKLKTMNNFGYLFYCIYSFILIYCFFHSEKMHILVEFIMLNCIRSFFHDCALLQKDFWIELGREGTHFPSCLGPQGDKKRPWVDWDLVRPSYNENMFFCSSYVMLCYIMLKCMWRTGTWPVASSKTSTNSTLISV